MTEEELAAAVALICGKTVKFACSVRTKKGKATSTWMLYRKNDWAVSGGKPEWAKHPERMVTGPSKAAAWAQMEVEAIEWADQIVDHAERVRKYWEARGII